MPLSAQVIAEIDAANVALDETVTIIMGVRKNLEHFKEIAPSITQNASILGDLQAFKAQITTAKNTLDTVD